METLLKFMTENPWPSVSISAMLLMFIIFLVLQANKVALIIKTVRDKNNTPLETPIQNKCDLCVVNDPGNNTEDKKSLITAKQFVKAISVPTIFINFSHKIIAVNHPFEELTGFTEDELAGLDLSVIIPKNHASKHTHYVEEYLNGVERDYNIRIVNKTRPIEVRTKSDESIPVQLKVSMINNGVKGFLGCMTKIESKKDT